MSVRVSSKVGTAPRVQQTATAKVQSQAKAPTTAAAPARQARAPVDTFEPATSRAPARETPGNEHHAHQRHGPHHGGHFELPPTQSLYEDHADKKLGPDGNGRR